MNLKDDESLINGEGLNNFIPPPTPFWICFSHFFCPDSHHHHLLHSLPARKRKTPSPTTVSTCTGVWGQRHSALQDTSQAFVFVTLLSVSLLVMLQGRDRDGSTAFPQSVFKEPCEHYNQRYDVAPKVFNILESTDGRCTESHTALKQWRPATVISAYLCTASVNTLLTCPTFTVSNHVRSLINIIWYSSAQPKFPVPLTHIWNITVKPVRTAVPQRGWETRLWHHFPVTSKKQQDEQDKMCRACGTSSVILSFR